MDLKKIFLLAGIALVASFTVLLLLSVGFGVSNATSSNTVSGSVSVPKYCYTSLSNTAVQFGGAGLSPGVQSAVNTVTVSDTNGNVNANIFTSVSGAWTGTGVNTFGASNTLWSNTLAASLKVAETTSLVDTTIVVPSGNSNSIYYMANVPFGQNADTYTQTINIEDSC